MLEKPSMNRFLDSALTTDSSYFITDRIPKLDKRSLLRVHTSYTRNTSLQKREIIEPCRSITASSRSCDYHD